MPEGSLPSWTNPPWLSCLGHFSLLCCGAGSLHACACSKRGSQHSAGWWGAGQAQLSRGAWSWALLTRWSQRNPAAWLATLPEASLHHHWHTLIHWGTITCKPAQIYWKVCLAPFALLAQPTLPTPDTSHSRAVLGSILGTTSTPWTQHWHRRRAEDRVLYYIWKHSFHFGSKLLVKSHLTDSRVIAMWAVLEFRRQVWLRVHLTIRWLIPSKQAAHHCVALDT